MGSGMLALSFSDIDWDEGVLGEIIADLFK